MDRNLILRKIKFADCQTITDAFKEQKWNKPVSQYHEYINFQERGERDIIIAELDGVFAGYLTVQWKSDYMPFADNSIPEIIDFNVLKKYQRRGIGTVLMDQAEARIKKISNYSGIRFGVYKDYGPARILYINRGYIPDGNGISKNCIPLKFGDVVTIDDDLAFGLIKKLQS